MKIAYYTATWPLSKTAPNGVVSYVANLVPCLRAMGHEVYILTNETSVADNYVIDLRLIPIPKCYEDSYYLRTSFAIGAALRHLRKQGLDLFEIEEAFGFAGDVAELGLVPVVTRLHGPWFLVGRFWEGPPFVGREEQEGRSYKLAQAVSAPSVSVANSVRDFYGAREITVIPNPVPVQQQLWDVSAADRNLILYVGRFDRHKGGDIALRAFRILVKKYEKLRFCFVGSCATVDGLPISHQLAMYGLVGRVDVFSNLCREEIQALRTRAFVTMVATRYDTFSIATLEALAAGSPLVATNVGGIPEVVGENGILVPPEDPEALASGCDRMLSDPALAVKLGASAVANYRFTPEMVAEKTIEFYRSIRPIAR